jgi:hypothetical protein
MALPGATAQATISHEFGVDFNSPGNNALNDCAAEILPE